MPRHARSLRLLALGTLVIATTLVGCGGESTAPASPAAPAAPESTASAPEAVSALPPALPAATTPANATYKLRGRIARLPQPGDLARELTVSHEAIPTFADPRGNVVGMDAMQMPFALGPEVDVAGLAVGDLVEMQLEMRWNDSPSARVAHLAKLPPDTPLTLAN